MTVFRVDVFCANGECIIPSSRHYSPGWALASSTTSLHCSLSFVFSIHCFMFTTFKSATTSSIHLRQGLITLLISCIFPGINIVRTFQVAIIKSNFQTSFVIVCFICFSSCRGWLLGFGTNYFYGVGLSAPRPTTNLADQGIPFRLGHHPWPVWHAKPYQ